MNGALEGRTFPERWRRAKLVLIPKDDGTEDRKFRPICLIDALGKVLEHLIKARLQKEVEERGGLSDNQFGFRQGLSTMDAVEEVLKVARFSNSGSWGRKEYCGLVALDVENAFNTASWERIVTAMDAFEVSVYVKEMIQTYLTDRTLIVSGGLQQDIRVSCGVPQGSVLGPILWNIMYDGVLRLEVPVGVRLVAFADDLAVMAMAATKEDLQNLVNRALERVSEWMRGAGLRLAARKTEAVLLTGKRRPGKISFYLDGEEIVPRETIRYLGVRLDRNMTFGAHVEEAAAKAGRMADALGRIMPNVGGARSSRRRLLAAVVHSKLLYGAPAWAGALKYKRNTDILVSAQRRALLRIASAYKTTSAEAIQVITGVLPVDLQVRRLNLLYRTARARSEVDEALLCEWQRRWVSGEKAAWTRTLIPDISMWVKKKHGELDYHLTQALTGHGCFATFLRRIGKEQDDRCWYCGDTDDVEHTLFVCEEWDGERLVLMKQTMHWPEKGQVRSGQVRSGQVRSGQVRSGQVRSGQVRSGQVRSGQVRSGQVRSGQVRSGQVRSGQVRSGQVRSGQVRSGQVRSGQVRSGQVRSGQVRSGQVRSGQVRSGPLQGAVRPCRWWRGLSNRSDARGDAGGSFALLAGSPMPARVERTGEKQRTAQPSGSTTKVVARELANPGEIRATVGRTRTNRDKP
jgi:hypothetical protein